jgi:hypothetical protein
MNRSPSLLLALVLPLAVTAGGSAEADTRSDAEQALRRAAEFFSKHVASGGGYVWRYSSDLKYRQGEGVAGPGTIWNQPPGTPAVGAAFLEAYAATGDRFYLDAAHATGQALVQGQLESGGWYYRTELDPARRREFRYRADGRRAPRSKTPDPEAAFGGWDLWKKHLHKDNTTIVDDDVTPSAIRFLVTLDKALEGRDSAVHEAALYALESLLKAQHPIGAWSHNYDSLPERNPDLGHYPILTASFPDTWPRTWPNDWTGCYSINDRVSLNVIKTMLAAWEAYHDERFRASAERGGEFLIRAQMPDPQPAWVQQYDRAMHPVWDRKFEPPAITGLESQDALETLLLLARATGDRKFLAPIPRALDYLKASRLPDGRLARFYELQTNRPLYFTRDYTLAYDGNAVPTHYGFVFDSRLDAIEAEFERLNSGARSRDDGAPTMTPEREAAVRAIITAQDPRGAWLEPGAVRDLEGKKVDSSAGIIQSATFVANVHALAECLAATRK